jgi:hypothetical protein
MPNEIRYQPVGQCIYCGVDASTESLSDEHIIPLGLGGYNVLPDASCERCRKITGGFEGFCLQQMLGEARTHLKIPEKRKRRRSGRPESLGVGQPSGDGTYWTQVPVAAHPFFLRMYIPGSPRELTGEPHSDTWPLVAPFQWTCINDGSISRAEALGSETLIKQTLNARYFCLMLGKIAHSLAIAVHGRNYFVPLIGEIIWHQEVAIFNYVGGATMPLPNEGLHQISSGWKQAPAGQFLTVRIQLFSWLGAPTYEVVVGRPIFT